MGGGWTVCAADGARRPSWGGAAKEGDVATLESVNGFGPPGIDPSRDGRGKPSVGRPEMGGIRPPGGTPVELLGGIKPPVGGISTPGFPGGINPPGFSLSSRPPGFPGGTIPPRFPVGIILPALPGGTNPLGGGLYYGEHVMEKQKTVSTFDSY